MGTQYDRAFNLTIGGQTIASLSGDPDNSLRVRFKVVTLTSQTPNWAQIIVTNLSAQTASSYVKMVEQKAKIELSAGYVDNSGLIFSGDSWYTINGRESPTDTTLQLFARDGGLAYDYGVVNKSLAAGSTPKDHYDTFLGAVSQFGITAGYTPDMSTPKYPRGVAFFGMLKDHMRTWSASNQCVWSIQQGKLQMTPVNGTVPGAPYELNASTGLLGMPTQTPGGIMVRCLINPAINLGSGALIHLNNADIQKSQLSPEVGADAANAAIQANINADGLYRIYHIETTGDSRGNDWQMDLTCFNASTPPANIPSGLLPADASGGNTAIN